jgi:hypothetical protein
MKQIAESPILVPPLHIEDADSEVDPEGPGALESGLLFGL